MAIPRFRAYVKNLQWVVPVEVINYSVETVEVDLSSGQGDYAEYDFSEVILMQYIGPINNLEIDICEGDIFYIGDNKEILYFIEKVGSCFMVKRVSNPIHSFAVECIKNSVVVIGDVYANPELITNIPSH